MLEFNPQYYKQKPSAKYHLIFFFCNFIIDFLSFRRCSTKGAALRKEPLYEKSRTMTEKPQNNGGKKERNNRDSKHSIGNFNLISHKI